MVRNETVSASFLEMVSDQGKKSLIPSCGMFD